MKIDRNQGLVKMSYDTLDAGDVFTCDGGHLWIKTDTEDDDGDIYAVDLVDGELAGFGSITQVAPRPEATCHL